MSMQVAFKKIQAARINGDYGPEQAYYNAESTPYPRVEAHAITVPPPDKHPQQPALLISELIQRYTTTRLADGAWKEHSLKDHTSRLENLVDLLGDKEAVTVIDPPP